MRNLLVHFLIATPLAFGLAAAGEETRKPTGDLYYEPPISELEERLTSKDPAWALSDDYLKALHTTEPELAAWIDQYRAARTAVDLVPLILPSVYDWHYRSQFKVDKRWIAIRKAVDSPGIIEALEMLVHTPTPPSEDLTEAIRLLAGKALDELDAKGPAAFMEGLNRLCPGTEHSAHPEIRDLVPLRQVLLQRLLFGSILESRSMKRPTAVAFGVIRCFAANHFVGDALPLRSLGFPHPENNDVARMLIEVDLDSVEALCHLGSWGVPRFRWVTSAGGEITRVGSWPRGSAPPSVRAFIWAAPELVYNFAHQGRNPLALLESVETNPAATSAELLFASLLTNDGPRRAVLARRAFAGGDKAFENLDPEFRDPVAIDLFASLSETELATLPGFIHEAVARHRKEMADLPAGK